MKELPITDAERRIMEALWEQAPASSRQIIEQVREHQAWSPKTIQTLIARLVDKHMVERQPQGRGYLYRPAIERSEFMQYKSRGFVERMFSGRVAPLVAAFAESSRLKPEDLRELKALVETLEQQSEEDNDGDA